MACESHGFFLLRCDDGVNSIEELRVSKQQHISPKPFSSFRVHKYMNTAYECFSIDDVLLSTSVETFTNLRWPQGNPNFCEILKGMSLKMTEISLLALKMIVEGYGLPQHYISDVENMKSCTQIRLNMYNTDANKGASNGHTDKDTLTVLCQNEVQGLQMLSRSGKWVDVEIPQNCFVVIVGDALKAWSNGRDED
ncbi:2-oxoglutarate-dependent dioxygenase AOP3-like [Vigna umbellata]|uniref:2-oxoglutarate-dependent dioxygenase AOP3-like n=1 Tax=Vigna umbellata TaxID=87088 RepID=UPI001F5F1E89|nr:2-oxoglutarate-dependent dioxygenase AOP3-like [Vigna umbellata]